MSLIARIAEVIIPVFLVVAVGYAYARRRPPDMSTLNRIALDVLSPMLVYTALTSKDFRIAEHVPLLVGGTLLILGSGALAWPLARLSGVSPRTLVPVAMFNNSGNMGLPLALLAFGPAHFGAAVALFSISNLFHFSLGTRITSSAARNRELLSSPLMLATLLGFASAVVDVRPPEHLMTAMKMLGDATLPIMLFALGVRLTSLTRSGLVQGAVGALARPLIGLAIGLPLVWLMGLDGPAKGQLLLFAALPPAVMQYMLAERYHQEPDKVAAMILLGNALAVVFVPLALALGL